MVQLNKNVSANLYTLCQDWKTLENAAVFSTLTEQEKSIILALLPNNKEMGP